MTSIRNTIATALVNDGINLDGYGHYIDLAVEALEEREYNISDQLVQFAQEQTSYGEAAIRSILRETELSERPAPEPETVTPDDDEPLTEDERLTKIEDQIGKLVEVVGTLTDLAKRHLGANL